MMERYAEMGTEVIEGYIGAVKSLDQALRRMPPPQFDTAGLGHAISPSAAAAPAWGDTSAEPAFSRQGTGRAPAAGWGEPAYRRDPWSEPEPEYGYGDDPRYPEEEGWYGSDPRYAEPSPYGERYPEDRYSPGGYPPRDPYGSYGDPRDPARRGDAPYPGRYGRDERLRDRRPADPRGSLQPRGRLLPPEERLRRPWLDEERSREPGSRRAPRAEWPDTMAPRRR